MYDTYHQWFDENLHFTSKKAIEKAAKGMEKSQFDPKGMIDKMIEIIPQEEHKFRTVHPENFEAMCQEYQNRQYEIKTNKIDSSKK